MSIIQSNMNHYYIDENEVMKTTANDTEFTIEENNLKYFIISIEHAYYFVKHPFTKRPCLPCFELARLLNMNEAHIPTLVKLKNTLFEILYRFLFFFFSLIESYSRNKNSSK